MMGNRIRALRVQRRMSRQALADYMGVSATAVYKWENDMAQPDVQRLSALANLFGVSLDDLCDFQPAAPEDDEAKLTENLTVMTRAFRKLKPDEREKYLAVGRALFAHAFMGEESAQKEDKDETEGPV